MKFLKDGGIYLFVVAIVGIGAFWIFNEDSASFDADHQSCLDPFEGQTVSFSTSGWNTDFCQRNIEFSEVLSGGVPRDGIPPIDDPNFESVTEASSWLQPQSPVVIVEVDGDARAYPLAILTRHEIVNDNFGDVPVAVTFCPLCNSAMAFERRIDGETLRLGVSGNLRNSDLIMWDDVTHSWWQQLTGEGIVGEHTGRQLTILPSQVFGFGEFAERFPEGSVLDRGRRTYDRNPYGGYDSNPDPFLFRGDIDDRLFPTARVLAVALNDQPIAYAFDSLAQNRVINDTVAGTDVVALWQPGAASALDRSVIDDSRDVGMAALYDREVGGQTLTFIYDEDADEIRDEQTDSLWNVFGEAIAGELEGTSLRQLLAAPHFWFAWAAFYPDTEIYESDA